MSYIMVDVEADGPAPGLYSMASFGAVVVRDGLEDTFYSDVLKPLDGADWIQEALNVSKIKHDDMLYGKNILSVMIEFNDWLQRVANGDPKFVSDNNGFDWSFINYYCWKFLGSNPFGHSSTNMGSMYKGLIKTTKKNFKRLRRTKHSHHPVDDAMGNAEALIAMRDKFHMNIRLD